MSTDENCTGEYPFASDDGQKCCMLPEMIGNCTAWTTIQDCANLTKSCVNDPSKRGMLKIF